MKKLSLISAAVATLLFTGCADKSPEVDMTGEGSTTSVSADSGVDKVAGGEEVIAGEGISSGESGGMDSLSAVEKEAKNIYFDFDKFNIRNDQVSNVSHDADLFKSEANSDYTIKAEGNCDEWGTDEYNYALGLKRGKSVKDALVDRGVAENRIVIVSYGESNPVCTEKTKECWQQNRRVEFKLLP